MQCISALKIGNPTILIYCHLYNGIQYNNLFKEKIGNVGNDDNKFLHCVVLLQRPGCVPLSRNTRRMA